MEFDKYLDTFQRSEIGKCWIHMSALTLVVAQSVDDKLLLVVEGASHIDDEGVASNEPVILGEVGKDDILFGVASLILDNHHDISIIGEYQWNLIKDTKKKCQKFLWSICWIKSEDDENKYLPQLLMNLTEKQIEIFASSYPKPNDQSCISIANLLLEKFSSDGPDAIQKYIDLFIIPDTGIIDINRLNTDLSP